MISNNGGVNQPLGSLPVSSFPSSVGGYGTESGGVTECWGGV